MAGGVTVRLQNLTLDQARITAPGSVVYRSVQRAAARTRDRAKVNLTRTGRIDTGRLRNSIAYEMMVFQGRTAGGQFASNMVSATIGTDVEYARYIHDGTANNGTGFIYPRRAKVLRFKPRGAPGFVYARRVRGIKATPFLAEALEQVKVSDFTL